MALAPGTPLGSYTVRSLLGAGGMGEVYDAVDSTRDLRVALKVLRRLNADSLRRFKQEFRTLAGVAHPNLAMLYELVSDAETWFFTMELVEGVDLIEYVWRHDAAVAPTTKLPSWSDRTTAASGDTPDEPAATGPTPVRPPQPTPADLVRLWRSFRQLADGLTAIHAQRKLHRDIKPSNVKVTPEGRVVVLDFGLITAIRSAGLSEIIGTIDFMSPEQRAGRPLHEASDWYSFGVVLYLALGGRLPWPDAPRDAPLHSTRPPAPPLSSIVTGVPPALERLTMALLAEEPEARPPGALVRAAFATTDPIAITTSRAAAPPAPVDVSPSLFVGRSAELRALDDALASVSDGAPVVALVSGRSGIGKSALSAAFLDRHLPRSHVVLRGRCFQQESVPYKAIDGIVDSLTDHLERLGSESAAAMLPRDVAALATIFPVLRRLPAVEAAPRRLDQLDELELRRRAFVAFKELLARIGDRATLILHIDDLQWGDSDSAALLTEILRAPDAPGLLLLGTYRADGSAGGCVDALRDAPRTNAAVTCREIALEPLGEAEARSMASALLPSDSSPAAVDAIVRESGGVPYFLQELSVSAAEGGPRTAAGAALTLDQSIRERVARLPADLQRYLHVVAVAGRPIADALAVSAAGLSPDLRILTTLRAGNLVRTTGSPGRAEVTTYHDRIRESVVAGLDPGELARLHGRLADTLAREDAADDEMLAIHYDAAGDTTRARPRYVAAAARASRALAFNHAVSFYARALELAPDPASARALRVSLAEALANAGRALDAGRAYEAAAADTPDPAEGFELNRRAGYAYASCGAVVEGRRTFSRALARFGMRLPASPGETFVRLMAVQLRLRWRGMRFTERAESAIPKEELARIDAAWSVGTVMGLLDIGPGWLFTSYALLLALKGGEPTRVARALAWEAATMSSMSPSGQRRAAGWLATCDALAARFSQPYLIAMNDLAYGIAAYSAGAWPDAASRLDAARARFEAECPGSNWERTASRGFMFRALLNAGEYARVRPQLVRAQQLAVEVGDRRLQGFLGAYIAPHLSLVADQPRDARRSIEESIAGWAEHGFFMNQAVAGQSLPMVHLYEGDVSGAAATLDRVWPDFKRHHFLSNMVFLRDTLEVRSRISIARAAVAPDPGALASAEADCRRLLEFPTPYLSAHAAMIRGAAAKIAGRDDDAGRLLAEAADGFDRHDMGAAAACARYVLGTLRRDDALRARAAEALQARSVVNADRFARLLVPGYLPPS